MKKGRLALVVAFLIVGCFTVASLSPALAAEPPKKVKLDYDKGKKGAVEFDHEAHGKVVKKCDTCHHKGGNVKCFDCHKEKKTDDNKVTIKKAFHDSCKNCHKKTKKENKDTKAPTSCKGCHK